MPWCQSADSYTLIIVLLIQAGQATLYYKIVLTWDSAVCIIFFAVHACWPTNTSPGNCIHACMAVRSLKTCEYNFVL